MARTSRASAAGLLDATRGGDRRVGELQARILWGMFTGAYSYRHLLRMALSPGLLLRLSVALAASLRPAAARRRPVGSQRSDGPAGVPRRDDGAAPDIALRRTGSSSGRGSAR